MRPDVGMLAAYAAAGSIATHSTAAIAMIHRPSRGARVKSFVASLSATHGRVGRARLSNVGVIHLLCMPHWSRLLAVALVSATLLLIELALTRIFSVVMYYHFAFLAI